MPDRPFACLALAALVLLLAACSHAPRPASPAKTTATPAAPQSPPTSAAAPAQPATAAKEEGSSTQSGNVVVIDQGQDESRPKSLVEAARAERERKSHAGQPTAVITNKSLARSTGQLTHAQPAKGSTAKSTKAVEKPAAAHDEAYWRRRGLDIRVRWRQATEDADRLEKAAAELRRRFYSQDDPAVRDAQIKPEWDRTLELLDHARLDIVASKAELAAFMEEGRRAGALPGWLREGADQEPEKTVEPASPLESIEPPVLKEGPP